MRSGKVKIIIIGLVIGMGMLRCSGRKPVRLSFVLYNASVVSALDSLRHKTTFRYFGDANAFKHCKPVTAVFHEDKIPFILNTIFEDQPAMYEFTNDDSTEITVFFPQEFFKAASDSALIYKSSRYDVPTSENYISIDVKQAPLDSALMLIAQKAYYNLGYSPVILKRCKKVTMQVSGVNLKQALDICCKGQPVHYIIDRHGLLGLYRYIVLQLKYPLSFY